MKNAIRLAVLCIVVGLIGVAFFGFEFGDKRVDYDQELSFQAEDIDSLLVKTEDSTHIIFTSTDENNVSVHFKGKWKPDTIEGLKQLQPENARLTVDTRSKDSFSFFSFSTDFSKNVMEISIPKEKWLTEVSLDNVSSDNDITGLYAKRITLKSTSGNLNLSNIQAEELSAKLTSGTMKADQVKASEFASFELTSGNLKLSSIEAKEITTKQQSGDVQAKDIQGNYNASLTSGNLTVDGLAGEGTIRMKSGDVDIVQKTKGNLDIETISGNVDVEATSDFAGFYDVQATSGNIHTPDSLRTGTELIKVRTISGDIKITQP
ncbi:DUF4097 family beta strand repeat-containing protein [Paenibacillus sp. Marseille-Q4541]|uniref:DUF4097 family beta strand repeat-containing protein n=1 Tax=Paenibacillus sp. Marseille-Q4541 TaxID=2831522 RepID=UPI001BA46817|nr:DUF4097 family beta strand repeat-containing protein [Paenibacillus sp. Marseille-Q4541]